MFLPNSWRIEWSNEPTAKPPRSAPYSPSALTAKASEVVATLAAQKVKVTPAQVYNLKSTMGKLTGGNGKPAAKKASAYESLIQAKRLADVMGGVEKARAALDVLAKLV